MSEHLFALISPYFINFNPTQMLISSAPLKSRIRTRLTISKINVRPFAAGEISLAVATQLLSLSLSRDNQPNPPSNSFTDLQKLFLIKDSVRLTLTLTHRTFLIKERTISPSSVVSSVRHPRSANGRKRRKEEARRNETRIVSRGKNGERRTGEEEEKDFCDR